MFDYDSILSAAHVDFSNYLSVPAQDDEKFELQWRRELLDSPNGRLILHNRFFDSLNQSTVWLAHLTSNLQSIEASGLLRLSVGSLAASIYCVPASYESGRYSLHNLGSWIYSHEMPIANSVSDPATIDVILIKIQMPNGSPRRPIGIDYTKLGSFYYAQYVESSDLLTKSERSQLEDDLERRLTAAIPFLTEIDTIGVGQDMGPTVARRFIDTYASCTAILPILGYLYFEVLTEYILCYQNDPLAEDAALHGEFYTHYYKRVAQDARRDLFKGLRLASFAPTVDILASTIKNYSSKGLLFTPFNESHFLQFLACRLAYMVRSRCTDSQSGASSLAPWPLKNIPKHYLPLVGHLINLRLRTLPRSLELYYRFGYARAKLIWGYWDKMGILVPFNGILPRGEVGINPNYCTGTTCTMYRAAREGDGSFILDRELDVKVSHELIHPRYTVMGYKKISQVD